MIDVVDVKGAHAQIGSTFEVVFDYHISKQIMGLRLSPIVYSFVQMKWVKHVKLMDLLRKFIIFFEGSLASEISAAENKVE